MDFKKMGNLFHIFYLPGADRSAEPQKMLSAARGHCAIFLIDYYYARKDKFYITRFFSK